MAQTPKPIDIGIEVGTVFLNKYRVDAIIGHGGMGVVAECTHLALNERVAIKMLRKDVLLDAEAVERFKREAQAAAKLKSEYVARVSDVGTFEGNIPYMVMEFLEGHDLGQLLDQRGVLPVAWASELILQTAEALAEAHSHGIVHRDVKPTNLFVTWRPDGTALIKVLDFGISKSPMGTDMQLTQTQSLLGTPAYMSPEQMRSARLVDWRSDIWSLGSVYYELLEGRRPFEAESFSEMCVKVAVDSPAPMTNTPPALQHVILKCLAKVPEQRYATMADLARDLIPFVQDQHQAQRLVERMTRMLQRSSHTWDGDSSSVMTPTPSPFPRPPGMDRASSPVIMMPREKSQPVAAAPSTLMSGPPKRNGMLIVVAVGLVVGVGIALAVAFGGGSEPAKPVPAPVGGAVEAKHDVTPPPKPVDPTPVPPTPPPTGSAGSALEPVAVGVPAVTPSPKDPKDPKHPGTQTKKKPPPPGTTIKKEEPPVVVPTITPPPIKDQTVKPPPAVPCDPFGSMHGCNADGTPK